MNSRREVNSWHRVEHCSRRSVRSAKLAAPTVTPEFELLQGELGLQGTDSEMLHARIQTSFYTFLQIELEVGFTFARLARTHHMNAAKLQFEKARRHANFAIQTVRRFESLIQDDVGRLEITDQCSELEGIVGDLYCLDPLTFN